MGPGIDLPGKSLAVNRVTMRSGRRECERSMATGRLRGVVGSGRGRTNVRKLSRCRGKTAFFFSLPSPGGGRAGGGAAPPGGGRERAGLGPVVDGRAGGQRGRELERPPVADAVAEH